MADQKVIGVCPRCGSNLVVSPKAFGCENRDCKALIWKENKYFESIGLNITEEQATELFNTGAVYVEGLRSKKKGTTFNATVKADFSGDGYPQYSLEFNNDK